MAEEFQVKILRATKIGGELKRPGDIVTVGVIDFNTLLHFAKAEAMPKPMPAGEGPKADERESELKARMTKRGRTPKPAEKEIAEDKGV